MRTTENEQNDEMLEGWPEPGIRGSYNERFLNVSRKIFPLFRIDIHGRYGCFIFTVRAIERPTIFYFDCGVSMLIHSVPWPASVQMHSKRGSRNRSKQVGLTVRSTGRNSKIVPQYGMRTVM